MSVEFDHDDFADLDADDVEALAELSDDELVAAVEALHGPHPALDPLDDYATPVTRPSKPDATDRTVHDVLRTL
ncbi:hypothetical protein AB0M00_19590 [Streptomyces chartreusis]|uniref:hypothetical protein n=1 Tax=Streptomyces chartreusis TaxID=1969 RepID=UPI00342A63A8